MLQFLTLVVVAFAPGVFWMWLIYRWDRYQPEPRWLVIRTFLWGMAIVLPIALVEWLLMFGRRFEFGGAQDVTSIAYQAFIVAGMTEELGKFAIVRLAVYKSVYFDESTDGIVYASAVSLGFASLENLFYILSHGWEVILIRGSISTMAHVLFSVIWGYPLALQKIKHPRADLYLWLGLAGAMAAHGVFDFLLFTQTWYGILVFPLLIGLVFALNIMLKHSRRISAFRKKVVELRVICEQCGVNVPSFANYCPTCGAPISRDKQHGHGTCSNCGASISPVDSYCTTCGSRVVRKPGVVK
jgi:RsiW-degrading membrane proteinase PrsW (M82 family)